MYIEPEIISSSCSRTEARQTNNSPQAGPLKVKVGAGLGLGLGLEQARQKS